MLHAVILCSFPCLLFPFLHNTKFSAAICLVWYSIASHSLPSSLQASSLGLCLEIANQETEIEFLRWHNIGSRSGDGVLARKWWLCNRLPCNRSCDAAFKTGASQRQTATLAIADSGTNGFGARARRLVVGMVGV